MKLLFHGHPDVPIAGYGDPCHKSRAIPATCLYFLLAALAVMTFMTGPASAAEDMKQELLPVCDLSISFDLEKNLLQGKAEITFPESKLISVFMGTLKILSAELNGKPVEYMKQEGLIKVYGRGPLTITYEGIFRNAPGDLQNLENAGVVTGGVIGTGGISLTGNWYPSINGLSYYRLSALVPGGFEAISEADEITYRETQAGREYAFSFPHPRNSVSFVAGHYKEVKSRLGDIDIYAYFFPEDISLADTYIEYTKKYLAMYDKLLVPYPYKRFSVVENIQPTGFSMPTFTLLGQAVVRLPFIVQTSLGHEITHQWFGNYVYADFQKGNWLEGITTYLSDYLYQEQQGKGWEYRKKILTDYQSYVTPEKEFPLRDFTGRVDFASEAIGYGKGAMVFHMLRRMVGDDVFYRSLRKLIENNRFRNASWEDIRKAFETNYGKDLGWFFSQWLDRKGVPSLVVEDPGVLVLNGTPTVSFILRQEGEPYKLSLTLDMAAGTEETIKKVEIGKKKQYLDIATDEKPGTLVIDRDYDVMRKLQEDEFPPVISRLLGDDKRVVVYSEKDKDTYSDLIRIFKADGFAIKDAGDLKDDDIRASSLLVFGYESPVLRQLFAGIKNPGSGFILSVRNNPLNTAKVVAYANAESREEVTPVAQKIFHYGKYTAIRFEKGRNVAKDLAETGQGMVFSLAEPAPGIVPEKSLSLEQIINDVADRPVIFIGERHSNYEDHKVELNVIMGLYKKGRKFAIGMEMFQRPFQKAIDDYIAGQISEREFLRKTEYFKRWGFDYNLYREIIEFARAKKIPIIALNLRAEIIKKVASGGLDALSPEEKKEIPQDMNMADDAYRQRLRDIFEGHPPGTTFDNFYQSQLLWDETMAHSAADFLKEKPDSQLVIMAGEGHIMYDYGIPDRLHRLTGREYVTLINGTFDRDIGNYTVMPEPLDPPFSARLGIIIKAKEGKVIIQDFSPGSPARDAGMEKGDVLVQIDDWKIRTVEDPRIALFDKKPFETVHVKVSRKRFLFGHKELEFDVAL